jgi:hypothetical protein
VPIFAIVLILLFGSAGFFEAKRFGEKNGRTPWGWEPLSWGLFLGLLFLPALICLAIAERNGRKEAASRNALGYLQASSTPPVPAGAAHYAPPAAYSQPSAYPPPVMAAPAVPAAAAVQLAPPLPEPMPAEPPAIGTRAFYPKDAALPEPTARP